MTKSKWKKIATDFVHPKKAYIWISIDLIDQTGIEFKKMITYDIKCNYELKD